jgi:UDP-glucose 6-dehydrogenase|tara:strand:- start:3068 stop:4024 length:957 start_codon:yes stop_codon:yes gene_type:complete
MGLRTKLLSTIRNLDNNANIAQDHWMRSGYNGFRDQMYSYIDQSNKLKEEVLDSERDEFNAAQHMLVVGCGFVGNTVADYIETNSVVKVTRIDPIVYPDNIISDYTTATCAIVAVPTPSLDNNKCDDSIVRSVIDQLMLLNKDIHILLKSTVSPEMMSTYPSNVTYCPEFLRAETAKEDFDNQKTLVIGVADNTGTASKLWESILYTTMNPDKYWLTDRNTACMVKYVHNTWLATKVAFFHEVYSKTKELDYDYSIMTDILSGFENIGPSHMKAENEKGTLGFAGHCFPKDILAFHEFTGSSILKQVIDTNNELLKSK